ncbi:MAG: HAMP domain-containing protein [Dehalococcoidia bacterium]|nr:HAMP domain-containing protein [Dehalococcoidia bacterium]
MSLRRKMVIAIAGLILVLGIVGTLYARSTLWNTAANESDRRALAISHELESHAVDLLLTNDLFGLHRRVRDLAENHDDVRYVVVFDASGRVRASTFAGALPAGLRGANSVPPGEAFSLVTVKTDEGEVRDVAYPIQGGRQGTIRLGFTRQSVQSQVDTMTRNLFALTGLALISGLSVAWVLATVLTRPLSQLAEGARAVGRGESYSQEELYTHPELGQVAVAFDVMTIQLREKEEERAQLLARVLWAQEDERKRIARELHDDAGQALTSVVLGLTRIESAATDEAVRRQATELKGTTHSALHLMRDLARDLRPSTLDDLGLVAALGRYVSDYGTKHGIAVHFHAASCEGMRLRTEAETALYRIAQEALTNVLRHAHATSINVLLECRGGDVILVVEDDGGGFQPGRGSSTSGLGLLGMEERASLVNGTLTVESEPGRGTAIFVQVPYA